MYPYNQEELFRLRDRIWQLLPGISPFGVRSIGVCTDELGGRVGLNVVLLANPLLWEAVTSSHKLTYGDRLVGLYREIAKQLTDMDVHYATSELMALAQTDETVSDAAGVTQQGEYVRVPPSNVRRFWNGEIPKPDPWGTVLSAFPFFNGENEEHGLWLKILLVPDEQEVTAAALKAAVTVTQIGWNLLSEFSANEFNQLTARLKDTLDLIDEYGGWCSL